DLLDMSRISRGLIQLRKTTVVVSDVVESAIESARPLIDRAGHALNISLPSEPIVIHADGTRLAQVLLNLLNNAAKYTEPGGQIELNAATQGDDVVIQVQDNGLGIPSEMLPHIFEMFTQVPRGQDHISGGLGIGLSLVRSLVELHGGMVGCQSEGP